MKRPRGVVARLRNRDHAEAIRSAVLPVQRSIARCIVERADLGAAAVPCKRCRFRPEEDGIRKTSTQHSLGPGGSNGDTAYLGFSPSPDA